MNGQCRTPFRVMLQAVAIGGTLLFVPGCEPLRMLWNSDLEYHSVGDEFQGVEWVSVSSRTRVIASAKRVGIRMTANPDVTEIDVDETHYVRGTLQVVYTGRAVFQCRTMELYCERIQVTPLSGTRPRDVIWTWPATMNLATGGPHVGPF